MIDNEPISAKVLDKKQKDLGIDLFEIDCVSHITPWTFDMIESMLEHEDVIVIGLFYKSKLIGYSAVQIIFDDADLLTIAIRPQYQDKGYGSFLLDYTIYICRTQKCINCFLEVRKSNIKAQHLYVKKGFTFLRVRKDYYMLPNSTTREDALSMSLKL